MEVIKAKNLRDEDIVRAYHICARKCIQSVSLWSIIARHPYKVLHIFDRGNAAWDSFAASLTQPQLDSLNILAPIAQSKIDIIPLQAADALAHQTARHLELSMGIKKKIPRVLYSKQLWTPAMSGICRVIDTPILSQMYWDERRAEQLRMRGFAVRQVVDLGKATPLQKRIADDLFREPKRKGD